MTLVNLIIGTIFYRKDEMVFLTKSVIIYDVVVIIILSLLYILGIILSEEVFLLFLFIPSVHIIGASFARFFPDDK